MQLSCVVVLYNPTIENINGIKSYLYLADYSVIIDNSDNGADNSDYFKNCLNVCYVNLKENKGLGYALNIGCKEAIKKGFKYVITMDQDSVLSEQGFELYKLSILNYPNAALISPQYIIDRKKSITFQNKIDEIDWTMQSASIFNLEILSKLNFFNAEFFIDVIDYEYCLRAKQNGYLVLKYFNYAIKHNPAITKRISLLDLGYGYCSPLRIYYQSRNLRYLKKQYHYHKITFVLLIKYLKILLLFDNKKQFFKMWNRGKKDFKNNKLGKFDVCSS